MKNRKNIYLALLVTGTSLVFFALKLSSAKSASLQSPALETEVKTASTEKTADCQIANFSGFVEGKDQVDLAAKVSGEIVTALKKEGDLIKTGETIFIIDRKNATVDVQNAQNNLAATQESRKKAGDYYDSLIKEASTAKNIAKDNGDDDAYAKAKKALASAETAKKLQLSLLDAQITDDSGALSQAGTTLADYTITAPYTGTILRLNAKLGSFVTPGTPLLTLANDTQLEIMSSLSKKEAANFSLGQTVFLKTGEKKGTGKIFAISPSGDSTSFKTLIRIAIDKDQPFQLGDFVQITAPPKNPSLTLTIPKNAVVYRYDDTFAFVVSDDNQALEQKITLGVDCGEQVEILSGLQENDRVVTDGKNNLKNNDLVKIYGE